MKISKTDILIHLKKSLKNIKVNIKETLTEKATIVGEYKKNAYACQNSFLIY